MNWYHEVDTEWLAARQDCLTATEIAKLVPEYKRSLKAGPGVIAPGFAALWAQKNSTSKPDPRSYGAAARGHWMEQFAIADWRKQVSDNIYYWDNCIITNCDVGFSPDAMDIEQTAPDASLMVNGYVLHGSNNFMQKAPTEIVEVKSYEAAHHMKCVLKEKDKQDELIQIATAFFVVPTLEKAHLLFYCPDTPISMKYFTYTREDLKDQILLVEEIADKWHETCEACEELLINDNNNKATVTEAEVQLEMFNNMPQSFNF